MNKQELIGQVAEPRNSLPALAAAVQRQFSIADIIDALRRQLARGESIRDFAGALEHMLLSAAIGAEESDRAPNVPAHASE